MPLPLLLVDHKSVYSTAKTTPESQEHYQKRCEYLHSGVLEHFYPCTGVEQFRMEHWAEIKIAEVLPKVVILEVCHFRISTFNIMPIPFCTVAGHRIHAPVNEYPELYVSIPLRKRSLDDFASYAGGRRSNNVSKNRAQVVIRYTKENNVLGENGCTKTPHHSRQNLPEITL